MEKHKKGFKDSGVTDGGPGTGRPPGKLKEKPGPFALHFNIYYSFGFSKFLFFCVFRGVFGLFQLV